MLTIKVRELTIERGTIPYLQGKEYCNKGETFNSETDAMTRTDARNLIEENARRTLVVRFVKRTTGELRRMVCIYFPDATEKATFRFNPKAKGLIAFWDLEKGARRFINLDGVLSVKLSGKRLEPKERREASTPRVRRAADREAKHLERPWENLEAADREMKALFG